MNYHLTVIILLSFFGQILLAGTPPSLANARYKKDVMPPDCRYQTSDLLWTRPQDGEWSRDVTGERSGLVNIYIHGSLEKIKQILMENDWVEPAVNKFLNDNKYAAFVGLDSDVLLLKEILRLPKSLNKDLNKISKKIDKTILTMPVTNEYFCTKVQAAAFELNNQVLKGRHHLRVFETGKVDQQNNLVWAIAANHDTGLKFDDRRRFPLSHKIELNTDPERDLVAKFLILGGAKAELPIPYTLSLPPPRDGATSEDRQAFELYMD